MEDRIKNVLDYIEHNLGSNLELKDLAAVACLSPSQFHRQFKRQTGRSSFKFVEELKVNKAYQMILQETWTVHDLSEHFGYKDYETFTRAFKKYFHFSPHDLTSIVEGVKTNMEPNEENEVMISIQDDENIEVDLQEKLSTFLEEKNVELTEQSKVSVFKITPKELEQEKEVQLIKNKFALTKDQKIWKKLLGN